MLALLVAAAAWPIAALAAFPDKPVHILVGYSAGTTSDIFARIIAQRLSERWGQPVIVENRDGAAGSIAADLVAKSAPDGYTLMLTSNAFTLGKSLRANLPYDPFADFYFITQVAKTPNIVLIGKGLGVKNLKEFIALAKTKPLQYASSGKGTPSQITVELLKSMAGIKLEEVPYKSSAQALTDTISGQLALNAPGIAQGLPFVASGKVIALGMTGSQRSPGAPDVPTIAEEGVPGYEAYGWHGMFAPAKLPKETAAFLTKEIAEVVKQPDMRQKFAAQGAEVVGGSSEEFNQFLRADYEKWAKLFRELGIKPE
jgi:tripartite-type tricarboxylate transporter receptor subunit TctC